MARYKNATTGPCRESDDDLVSEAAGKAGGNLGPGWREGRRMPGPGTIQLREGSASFEWFIARAELEQNRDLHHGASHLAKLLMFDPANQEWLDLLDRYLSMPHLFPKERKELEKKLKKIEASAR